MVHFSRLANDRGVDPVSENQVRLIAPLWFLLQLLVNTYEADLVVTSWIEPSLACRDPGLATQSSMMQSIRPRQILVEPPCKKPIATPGSRGRKEETRGIDYGGDNLFSNLSNDKADLAVLAPEHTVL